MEIAIYGGALLVTFIVGMYTGFRWGVTHFGTEMEEQFHRGFVVFGDRSYSVTPKRTIKR